MLMISLILFVFLLILFWRVVIWFVGTIGAAKGLEEEYRKYTRSFGIFIAVATVLFFIGDEIYTKKQFEQLCKKEAGLKIYKTVDNIDGFLHMTDDSDTTKYFDKGLQKLQFYENIDRENKYKIKEYYTKKDNNQYSIDYFIVLIERKYIGKGKYKETVIKENKINFNNYKINRYTFINNEYAKEENIQPKSRYVLLEARQSLLNKFGVYKMIIFDVQDYSVMAEHIVIASGGGRLSEFLGSFYGGSYVGNCGLEQGRYISPLSLIKRIF